MDTTAAESRFETLLYVKKGSTAYVTLNRPKVMNALNQKAIAELTEVFTDSRDDASIRGVILTGAGDKAFIAGADISELARATPIQAQRQTRAGQSLSGRESRQARHCCHQWSGAWRRLRSCPVVLDPCGVLQCEVWSARDQARLDSWLRRNAEALSSGRKGYRASEGRHIGLS
jgi:hypothetical protein